MENLDVSIIIVNWNVRELLLKCLESIFKFTNNVNYEVIVIDNASNDGSTAELRKVFLLEIRQERLVIIENKQNLGFAKANNQGLREATGEYILFLNPDMELTENSILLLKEYHDLNPQLGLLTTTLLYGDRTRQPNVKHNPTLCSQLLIALKLHHLLKPQCLTKYFATDFDYDAKGEVEQIMGACIFAKRNLLNSLNGFDEDYPLWWEDVDLCRRVQNLKRPIVYNPITAIIHFESKSFEQLRSLNKQKRFLYGLKLYFKKHQSRYAYWVLTIITPISLFLAYLAQLTAVKPRPQSRFSRHYGS